MRRPGAWASCSEGARRRGGREDRLVHKIWGYATLLLLAGAPPARAARCPSLADIQLVAEQACKQVQFTCMPQLKCEVPPEPQIVCAPGRCRVKAGVSVCRGCMVVRPLPAQ